MVEPGSSSVWFAKGISVCLLDAKEVCSDGSFELHRFPNLNCVFRCRSRCFSSELVANSVWYRKLETIHGGMDSNSERMPGSLSSWAANLVEEGIYL